MRKQTRLLPVLLLCCAGCYGPLVEQRGRLEQARTQATQASQHHHDAFMAIVKDRAGAEYEMRLAYNSAMKKLWYSDHTNENGELVLTPEQMDQTVQDFIKWETGPKAVYEEFVGVIDKYDTNQTRYYGGMQSVSETMEAVVEAEQDMRAVTEDMIGMAVSALVSFLGTGIPMSL